MARSEMATRRLTAAAEKYLALRQERGRDVASRRARAGAEASLASELRDGRHITDDGVELSMRPGGRVRVRQVQTEPREPGRRAIARAQRYGYEGSPEEMRAKGREIRAALRLLGREEIEIILGHQAEAAATARSGASGDDDDDEAELERILGDGNGNGNGNGNGSPATVHSSVTKAQQIDPKFMLDRANAPRIAAAVKEHRFGI